MTPKERAEELILKYLRLQEVDSYNWFNTPLAKQCSLIAVDEIINSNPHSNPFNTEVYSTMDYWQEVKQEIIKL